MRRIFLFDENSLNSSSSSSNLFESQSTHFSSGQGSFIHQDASILNDCPGLNPSSERVVELQCIIREKCEELAQDPERGQILAEAIHCESDDIPFMESIVDDLTQNGVSGEAFREALNQVGQAAASPLDQFEIVPLIPMNIGNFYFSFTNPSLFMLLTLHFFLILVLVFVLWILVRALWLAVIHFMVHPSTIASSSSSSSNNKRREKRKKKED